MTKKAFFLAVFAFLALAVSNGVQAQKAEKNAFSGGELNLFPEREKENISRENPVYMDYRFRIIGRKMPDYDYSLKGIEQAVDFASESTGVRKGFIMGMLVVESDMGRNIGKCTYEEVEEGARKSHLNGQLGSRAWNTFKERRKVFKDIAIDAGYDYKKLKVSCNPSRYIGTGGAMGIAQFMPSTWMEYEKRIEEVTGDKNPDPWNPKHAAVAMALKLSDVPGVTNHNHYAERNAAKLYLSGTTSWQYNWYANEILYWSNNYKNLIG